MTAETGEAARTYFPPPRAAHLPGSSRSKETGHLRPQALGLRLEPAVAAGLKRGRPPQPPGPQGVPRLAGPGQDAGDSRGVLAGAQAGQRRWSRPYFTSARREATEWVLAGVTTRPTGAQLRALGDRSSLPRSLPTAWRTRPSRPRPAPPRPFRRRRRGESGPGGAHGRGGGNAATPAGDRASEDCAEARPGRSGARKLVPRVSTWLKENLSSCGVLGFSRVTDPFEHL